MQVLDGLAAWRATFGRPAVRGRRRTCWARAAALAAVVAGALALAPQGLALTIDETVNGSLGDNGWYTTDVTVSFDVSDPTGVAASTGCEGVTLTEETSGTTLTCLATTNGPPQVTKSASVTVKIDKTPPQLDDPRPERQPDVRRWYNHPVDVSFAATDAMSGLASCDSATYAGPDNANASLSGACRDNAGNVATASFFLRYDATPPELQNAVAVGAKGMVRLRWSASERIATTVVKRAARLAKRQRQIYRGSRARFADRRVRPGLEYLYVVRSFDLAGNASAPVMVRALPTVLSVRKTPYVPRVSGAPLLTWIAAPNASYYHVQLFQNGKRIYAAWPSQPRAALKTKWSWQGQAYRLEPGKKYRWFAWAGVGARSDARFERIGRGEFRVMRARS